MLTSALIAAEAVGVVAVTAGGHFAARVVFELLPRAARTAITPLPLE